MELFHSTERIDQSTRPSKIPNKPNQSLKSFIIFMLENPARAPRVVDSHGFVGEKTGLAG
jgi:hypothetical protein